MKELIVQVKDTEYDFLVELLKKLDFVTISACQIRKLNHVAARPALRGTLQITNTHLQADDRRPNKK